jgi:hypothetical protein
VGGDFRAMTGLNEVGDFSLGSFFIGADGVVMIGVTAWVADDGNTSLGDFTCKIKEKIEKNGPRNWGLFLIRLTCDAKLGKGSDMGSALLKLDKDGWAVFGFIFSGLSSQRGVPGLLPSDTSSAPATLLLNDTDSLLSKMRSGLLVRRYC